MRIVFMGTPDFAVPCIEALIDHHQVVAVVTQPDRKKGRGQKVQYSAVKQVALAHDIPLLQPDNINTPAEIEAIRVLQPDLLVVVAYGQLLKKDILNVAPLGAINVHASHLPHLRGGAPIHHAILRGYQKTGVTTMRIARKLDAGDIYLQETIDIHADETVGELHDRLAAIGAALLIKTLQQLPNLTPRPQDKKLASYAPNLTTADRVITWSDTAQQIHDQIRGLNPWPIAYTVFRGKQLQIIRANIVTRDNKPTVAPGSIVALNPAGITIQCGVGLIQLEMVRPASKRKMTASDFCRGYRCQIGECLGSSI